MDYERKDPDDEIKWRDEKTTEAINLIERLFENEDVSHDSFLKCINSVTEKLRECLKGEKMEKILEKLPKAHADILKDLHYNMSREKDKEMAIRMGCYFRGYVNCLRQAKLLTYDEVSYLNHQSITEDDYTK